MQNFEVHTFATPGAAKESTADTAAEYNAAANLAAGRLGVKEVVRVAAESDGFVCQLEWRWATGRREEVRASLLSRGKTPSEGALNVIFLLI